MAVSTEEAGGEVGFRPGRGAQPPLLPGGGQSRDGSGSWDSQQVSPPGSPVPTPCLAVSLMLPCPYDPSLIDPRTPLFCLPNSLFLCPLLLIHQKVEMSFIHSIKHELNSSSGTKTLVIIVIPKPHAQHWRKGEISLSLMGSEAQELVTIWGWNMG